MSEVVYCPLCMGSENHLFHQDNNKRTQRPYHRCNQCHLVFVPAVFYLTPEQEKAEYDQHENDIHDAGYEGFLNRLWSELKAKLMQNPFPQTILDFGCGPGPLLAKMMSQAGFDVSVYDHFYAPEQSVLKPQYYDAITSTEVIEHLHQPKQVFEQWLNMLKKGGYLGLMTKLVMSQNAFATWHYKNDLTHVCFFSEACFQWLAEQYSLELTVIGKDVIVFRKPE